VLKKVRFSREVASVLMGCMIQDTRTKVNNAPQNFGAYSVNCCYRAGDHKTVLNLFGNNRLLWIFDQVTTLP